MFSAPGPIDDVAAITWRRSVARAYATAASAMPCSFWPRHVGSVVAGLLQRGAEPQHVAVAEDREDPGEQRHLRAVQQLRALRGHPAHQRLRGRETRHQLSLRPAAEVIGQRGSVGMLSQVSRTQPCAGSSQNASSRSAPGPAITLR